MSGSQNSFSLFGASTYNAYLTMATVDTLYGYAAAAVACVAFGSFAVPIKSEAARRIDVDPLGTSKFKVLVTTYLFSECFLTICIDSCFFIL
jgi:hypothetical protein